MNVEKEIQGDLMGNRNNLTFDSLTNDAVNSMVKRLDLQLLSGRN